MTRQLEQDREDRVKKRLMATGRAIDGGLEASIERAGGTMLGYSIRSKPEDCLLIIRCVMPAGHQVIFIGGSDAMGCILKAANQANRDELTFVPDKYNDQ